MPGIEPADRSCTDTREHSPVLVSGLNKFIDAQTTPNAHHLQRVSTANVDDVCRQDLFPNMLSRRLLLDEQEDVRPALRNLAKYSWTRFRYLSESELAGGIKSSFGFFFFESRIVYRSIEAVPLVLIAPPPRATITLCICSSYSEPNSGAPPGFQADHEQPGSSRFVRRISTDKRPCVAFFRFVLKDRCSSTQQSRNRVPEAHFRVVIIGISVSKHANLANPR